MKHFFSCFVLPVPRILEVSVCLCLLFCTSRANAQNDAVTVTEPLTRLGLGSLACAASSPNPDAPFVATGGRIGVVLWHAETGARLRVLNAPGHFVNAVAFSPDAKQVLTGGDDHTAKLWDAEAGAVIRTFRGHSDSILSVAYSATGSMVLTGSADHTAKLWDAKTGAELHAFTDHSLDVSALAFSPDGKKVVTASQDKTAILWDAVTGEKIRTFTGHDATITSIAFSPGGDTILTGSESRPDYRGDARLWDIATGQVLHTLTGHDFRVASVAFSPDASQVLTGDYGGEIKLWNTATGAEIRTLSRGNSALLAVAFLPQGDRILTGAMDGAVTLWHADTGAEIRAFTGHKVWTWSVSFSPDGAQALTSNGEKSVFLWDTLTGVRIREFAGHDGPVYSAVFSPDGAKILTGSGDKTAKLWNVQNGAEIRTFPGHTDIVFSVDFSPDASQILTGSWDGKVKIWNAGTGGEIVQIKDLNKIYSVAFSPDGKKIAAGGKGGEAYIWDAATGDLIHTLPGDHQTIWSVAFTHFGGSVMTAGLDGTAKIWNTVSGGLIRTFSGNTQIYSAAFSSDSAYLLTGSVDSVATLWDTATGEAVRAFKGHEAIIWSVAFSPDGSKILVGGNDGLTLVFDSGLPPQIARPTGAKISNRAVPDKLILVAGGGPFEGNTIEEQTQRLAELTYITAAARGYTSETIYYISAFPTPPAHPLVHVDAPATSLTLEKAIRDWASDAARLTIVLLGHGIAEPAIPEWHYLLDGAAEPRDLISATELHRVLDDVQSGDNPLWEVFLYVDAIYAGGFINRRSSVPTTGTQRLVIAGTANDRLASFHAGTGSLSFTGFFMSAALEGKTLFECFETASQAIATLNVPASAPQTPWMDDDGDGLFQISDGDVARERIFGDNPLFDFQVPQITNAKPNASFPLPQAFELWCTLGAGDVKYVQAVVSHTETEYPAGAPITDFTTVELSRKGSSHRWSGTLTTSTLQRRGTHGILYTAARDDGFGLDLAAVPMARTVHIFLHAPVNPETWILY